MNDIVTADVVSAEFKGSVANWPNEHIQCTNIVHSTENPRGIPNLNSQETKGESMGIHQHSVSVYKRILHRAVPRLTYLHTKFQKCFSYTSKESMERPTQSTWKVETHWYVKQRVTKHLHVVVQGCNQKSGEGGAVVLFDIARIRKGVLEPLV